MTAAAEDPKHRLVFTDYHELVREGTLRVHVQCADNEYVLRGDSLYFSLQSVLLVSPGGAVHCCFPKRWILSINPLENTYETSAFVAPFSDGLRPRH
jgi:hypothetical protein